VSYHGDTYTEFENRIKDWLNYAGTGANVSNLPLDLANRAQSWLTMYKAWNDMIKTASLTLVSGNTYSLPTDFARIIYFYYDSDSDGKPDGYYHHQGRYNGGYKLLDTFAKATGHSRTVTFFNTLSQTPSIKYQFQLTDFAGTGTEYSFFPGELLLRTAQRLHIVETGLTSKEMLILIDEHKKTLRDYEQAHHYVDSEMRISINDDNGAEISTYNMNLNGDIDGGMDRSRGLSRSTDLRW
jgi:hypothetical protein